MSTLPRDVRIQALHEVGVKIDDTLESARLETARREGAHAAYVNAAKALSAHPEAAAICSSLASQAHNLVFASKGAEIQSKSLVALLKGMHDLEVARKQRETEPLVVAEPAAVDQGHPSEDQKPVAAPSDDDAKPMKRLRRTIKEERLALAASKSAEAAVSAPKRRGRPPKNPR
jgi:hypothetical protein